jgi:hypothetical protein
MKYANPKYSDLSRRIARYERNTEFAHLAALVIFGAIVCAIFWGAVKLVPVLIDVMRRFA